MITKKYGGNYSTVLNTTNNNPRVDTANSWKATGKSEQVWFEEDTHK